LPFAGAGAAAYRSWFGHVAPTTQVHAVRLPGRENRTVEAPFESIDDAVDDLLPGVLALTDAPYCIFGYSMGAVLGFELVRRLSRESTRPPALLIVGGAEAAHLPRRHPLVHDLEDEQFISTLRALGGTAPEIFEEPELLELLVPMVRADFKMLETYEYRPGPPLDCPIVSYLGASDRDIAPDRAQRWSELTVRPMPQRVFPGGHFFLTEHPAEVVTQVLDDFSTAAAFGLR
jgi:surfactin synthase thioesterase subunit